MWLNKKNSCLLSLGTYSNASERNLFEHVVDEIEPLNVAAKLGLTGAAKIARLDQRAEHLVDGEQDVKRVAVKVRVETVGVWRAIELGEKARYVQVHEIRVFGLKLS